MRLLVGFADGYKVIYGCAVVIRLYGSFAAVIRL